MGMDKSSDTTIKTATSPSKNDTDDEMDTTEIEEENWIDYMKRSTEEAIDKMDDAKIRCWIKTHKRMKWKMTLRNASLPNGRWMVKAVELNPERSSRYQDIQINWETEKKMGTRYQRIPQT